MLMDAVKKRDVSIDILKFFAVILITNSHMAHLYVKFSALATGGAIGDVFFFFCYKNWTFNVCENERVAVVIFYIEIKIPQPA